MKIERFWKRRFLRKKLKYTLICVFIVSIIFVAHQLVYFKKLNQVTVGKYISGSVRKTNYIDGKMSSRWNEPLHSKLLRDEKGRTVSLRGTRDQDISKYLPNVRGKFVCFTSKDEIDFFKINDNYCDCPLDGSDEPGTNACNNGAFNCELSSLQFIVPIKIPSYKVNDGYCDCCDGSDEWAEVKLSRLNNVLKRYKSKLVMHCDSNFTTVWDPLQIFNYHTHYKYAVVILNSPLYWKDNTLLQIWKRAQVNVTVDGGTYRWLHYLEEQGIDLLNEDNTEYVPNLITGDMDSCSPLILEKLKSMGSMIIKTPDQDHTDYTKALLQLGQYAKKEDIELNGIYVFADTSGRFDHIMGNINTLYRSDKIIEHVQVIQIANNSLTWVLRPGLHSIIIPKILVENNSWCGLLPIGAPVNSIITTGLKWNLNNATLQFGSLVSSSNTYDNCSEVTINTDSPVIWTMGIEPLQKNTSNYEISQNT
ncbi:uncharacterized protein LOC117211692 isoform X1 [Bombus bifarius]|uniref:Uncharacterized protein LOC117211692 isoform X1 n=1 Tax=Bombus bifarius TaxID=103933 RepID=A0A6P8NAW2_9HYME|nr:uncharacterized protein LOC117211692 isoform X1 [Bombus bifarius]